MKITKIQATSINIPYETPYRWMPGICPGNTTTIVEVTTNEGLVGVGEASSGRSAPVIADELAPRLAGSDPFDIEACERRCVREEKPDPHRGDQSALAAFAGIEMALWDLRGKAWQQPLYITARRGLAGDHPLHRVFRLSGAYGESWRGVDAQRGGSVLRQNARAALVGLL